jgi:site-specific DNA-methyltransferase (adenine-specific)
MKPEVAYQTDLIDYIKNAEQMPSAVPPSAGSSPPAAITVEIHHADCLSQLSKLPAKSVDAIVTSPPYNIGKNYGSGVNDRQEWSAYLGWIDNVLCELNRVLTDDGSLFLNVGGTPRMPCIPYDVLRQALHHFTLQNDIIWAKALTIDAVTRGQFRPFKSDRFLQKHDEHVFHLTKKGAVTIDRLAIGVSYAVPANATRFGHEQTRHCSGNIWFIPYKTVTGNGQRANHPASFPEELVRRCLEMTGKVGTVLDPFSGSGTTLRAATAARWHSVGIELNVDWFRATCLDFGRSPAEGSVHEIFSILHY